MYIWEESRPETRYAIAKNDATCAEAYRTGDGDSEIRVNVAIRFSEIFTAETGQAMRDGLVSDALVSAALRFLAHLDLLSSVTPETLERDVLSMEIRAGAYGEEIRERFLSLDGADRERVLRYLQKAPDGEGDLFDRVFLDFFGRFQNAFSPRPRWNGRYASRSAEIYYNRFEDTHYCYCAAEETEYNRNCFELARLLFADAGRNIRPVWGKRCFGVVGEAYPHAAEPVVGEIQML